MIERLETRQHLSATLAGNVLTIIGTDRADDIAIAAGKREFVVHDNGRRTAFDVRAVKAIRIHGLRGDDSIILSPKLAIRASIEAGPGNDRVGGGAGDDTIFGQAGADTLAGNDGDDYIDAGTDDDYVEDADGFNVIHGGGGNDHALGDPYRLGSGVEERNTSGLLDGASGNGVTNLRQENGRLILTYEGFLPTLSDSAEQSGPVRRADGNYDVTSQITFDTSFGGVVGDFAHRWDITDQAPAGIVLARTFGDRLEPGPLTYRVIFSVPFLISHRK